MTISTIVYIDFEGHRVTATLDDSVLAASLLALLPLTMQFRDFGDQEKVATLPEPLDTSRAPRSSAGAAATIAYYQPDQGLVLFYKDVGRFTGIMPLGTIDSARLLRSLSGGFIATVSAA